MDYVVNLRQWPSAHVYDVVEKSDAGLDGVAQRFPIDNAGMTELRDVDRAEIAGVVGMEKLFAAIVNYNSVGDKRMSQRLCEIVDLLDAF
jgi:hypothetical protein